mmetsp:Transcript_18492/g.47538  ORF Transcript_18492/g.47538 Transcript_18492/m.47538 type:complete len:217 (+) Transcript_18492:191-841(+)
MTDSTANAGLTRGSLQSSRAQSDTSVSVIRETGTHARTLGAPKVASVSVGSRANAEGKAQRAQRSGRSCCVSCRANPKLGPKLDDLIMLQAQRAASWSEDPESISTRSWKRPSTMHKAMFVDDVLFISQGCCGATALPWCFSPRPPPCPAATCHGPLHRPQTEPSAAARRNWGSASWARRAASALPSGRGLPAGQSHAGPSHLEGSPGGGLRPAAP